MPNPTSYRRELNCDFFRVNARDKRLPDLIAQIHQAYPNVEERNVDSDNGAYRLCNWTPNGVNGRGVLVRLRTDNRGLIANRSSDNFRDVDLNDGESLMEYFAFTYFDEFGVLVAQHNRDAGSHTRLAAYLSQLSGAPVHLEVILTKRALEIFRGMTQYTRADLKIAMPTDQSAIVSEQDSVLRATQLAHETGAASIAITLSMDRTKRPLNTGVVKETIDTLLRGGHKAQLERARIRGRVESGDNIRTVDLINDRMQERVAVTLDQEGRGFQAVQYYSALEEAYSRRRDEIEELYGTPSTQ